mmetsp:Transcript_102856/g.258051  ORF Transcript_102856/g.258051 Transcript_102856/m.258051 type:complete len:232 (-) Transcript_102856:18-713(-)
MSLGARHAQGCSTWQSPARHRAGCRASASDATCHAHWQPSRQTTEPRCQSAGQNAGQPGGAGSGADTAGGGGDGRWRGGCRRGGGSRRSGLRARREASPLVRRRRQQLLLLGFLPGRCGWGLACFLHRTETTLDLCLHLCMGVLGPQPPRLHLSGFTVPVKERPDASSIRQFLLFLPHLIGEFDLPFQEAVQAQLRKVCPPSFLFLFFLIGLLRVLVLIGLAVPFLAHRSR